MRILLSLLLSFLLSPLCAQYLPILEEGKVWYTRLYAQNHITTQILSSTVDSTFGSKRFGYLIEIDTIQQYLDTIGFVTEDTLSGEFLLDFEDSLLADQRYDFSLQLGDTIRYEVAFSSDTAYAYADSIFTYTDLNNVQRKGLRISLPGDSCMPAYVHWIEGIGSTGFLEYTIPPCNLVPEVLATLQCVFGPQGKIYGDTINNCFVIGMEEILLSRYKIYPNPASDYVWVKSPRPVNIQLLDMQGKVVLQNISQGEINLDIRDIPRGIYILHLLDEKRDIRKKLVVE